MLNGTLLVPAQHKSSQLTYESNKNFVLLTEPDDKENFAPGRRPRTSHSIDLIRNKEVNKKLEPKSIERTLPDKALTTNDFENNLKRAQENMQKLLDSKLPIELRIKMMDSIRETIQTQLGCIQERNKDIKKRILDCEKSSGLSTYICKVKEYREGANKIPHSRGSVCSSASTEEHIEELSPEHRELEAQKQENSGLEEVISKLRQTKNSISISIVDLNDDINDFQALMQEKKRVLDNKSKYIEELKFKISQESAKNSSNIKISPRAEKKENLMTTTSCYDDGNAMEHTVDKSNANLNSSIFQDVSTKVSDFVGKMFGKKQNNQILTKEVLQEISLNTIPTPVNEPKFLTKRRDRNTTGLKNDLNRHDLI